MNALVVRMLALTRAQSSLFPAGTQADQINRLWWLFFAVLLAVYILVSVVLFVAISRRRSKPTETSAADEVESPPPERERRVTRVVASSVAVTILILFVLLILDFFTGRSIYALGESAGDPLVIKVTGHQWWWAVQYENEADPTKIIQTANEIHVPVGRPIKLSLNSNDVIHSFWVPNMHGKKDLVPGHPTETWLRADKPGVFRGQCAEFCGQEHALMRLTFVAESPDDFANWQSAALKDAPAPTNASVARGQQVFTSTQCMMCHAISGTNARATVGPNLTHVASRLTLASGAIPNTRGYLAGWIANPQTIKPGVRMPPTALSSEDLNALIDYLETLK